MANSAYNPQWKPPSRLWCDCGNPKSSNMEACHRCAFLDGSYPQQAEIIDALRGTDGLTTAELLSITGRFDSALRRSLKTLLQNGRVRRYWRDSGECVWALDARER